ncbi:MAG: hypothetical protein Q8K78_13860 [Planctomycetaceae bacterium]|nr:hypothetical protein [Planctomycetaceae bacterium]
MRQFLLLSILTSAVTTSHAAPPAKALAKLNADEAAAYQIYLDEAHKQPLELRTQPIFSWTNVLREDGQTGHIYVWMKDGRPEAVATFFSAFANWAKPPRRAIVHEFHTLAAKKLWPVGPKTSQYEWQPQAGLAFKTVPDAPEVADSPALRLVQMRDIARRFSGETLAMDQQRWELRLLPQPALRYQPTRKDVLDGALFLYVSSAGTDPEVIIPVEARRESDGPWKWQYGIARFTDRELVVRHAGEVIWSSIENPNLKAAIENDYTIIRNPERTYTCYRSRLIDELPDTEPAP